MWLKKGVSKESKTGQRNTQKVEELEIKAVFAPLVQEFSVMSIICAQIACPSYYPLPRSVQQAVAQCTHTDTKLALSSGIPLISVSGPACTICQLLRDTFVAVP